MFYQLYEMNHASLQPARAYADAVRLFYSNPLNPFSHTHWGRSVAATAELFERTTRRYGKPAFGLDDDHGRLEERRRSPRRSSGRGRSATSIHFERDLPAGRRPDRKLLIVAPMSGHYATLLRGTVEAMLPHADVYITDWADARMVPLGDGRFDLDDYIDYLIDMLHALGPGHACDGGLPAFGAGAGGRRR